VCGLKRWLRRRRIVSSLSMRLRTVSLLGIQAVAMSMKFRLPQLFSKEKDCCSRGGRAKRLQAKRDLVTTSSSGMVVGHEKCLLGSDFEPYLVRESKF